MTEHGSAVRRLAMGATLVAALTLPAAAAVQGAATRPQSATSGPAGHGAVAGSLTAASAPTALPARGAGAADTTAADPAAAGKPGAASLTKGPNAIPSVALAAYRKAAAGMAVQDPSCRLTWPLLAGIGKVESDHGRSWGAKARITSTGEVVPAILGPVLDGKHGTALLLDTDGGAWDGDKKYDRAVGPMQFVPQTWREFGRDGNGDGIRDPNNMWDATLAAAGYLCAGDRDLSDPAQRRAAILAYNPSDDYVRAVLAWAAAYQKAAAKVPALAGVPDPLVLGANGAEGDDPFGDDGSYVDSGQSGDPNSISYDPSQGPSTDDFWNGGVTDPGDGGTVLADPPVTIPTNPPTKTPTKPTVKPTTKPTVPHTQAPTTRPAQTTPPPAGPTSKPTVKPTPTPTPTAKPTATPTPKPTPTPTPTPTASPTPTPTGPTCADPGVTAPARPDVTAVPVDSNADGVNDALRVTASVVASEPGRFTLGFRLVDASGWRITSVLETVALVPGKQQVSADLAGQDIGDAGASGASAVRMTVRPAGTSAECAHVIIPAAGSGATGAIGNVDASTYDGWVTSLDRLRQRLADDIEAGQVSGVAATALPKALRTPSADAPDLAAFRRTLAAAQVVTGQERVRLDSLAQRLIAQAAAGKAQPPAGSGDAPIQGDDVGAAADGIG